MKFVPRHNHIVGRMTIRKSESKIIRTDESKVTKFVLVDAVGPDAAAAGVSVGDLVVVTSLKNVVLDAGTVFMPLIEEKDVALFVKHISHEDLLIQTPNGKDFVAFDSPVAAQALGENPPRSLEVEGAAA